jgi:hypothetical protein
MEEIMAKLADEPEPIQDKVVVDTEELKEAAASINPDN